MAKYHLIFDGETDEYITEVALVADDPNQGLPDWYFEDGKDYYNIEIDRATGAVEWWPAVGPNPHWEANIHDFGSYEVMTAALRKWIGETFFPTAQ